jgi:hypothetical protein
MVGREFIRANAVIWLYQIPISIHSYESATFSAESKSGPGSTLTAIESRTEATEPRRVFYSLIRPSLRAHRDLRARPSSALALPKGSLRKNSFGGRSIAGSNKFSPYQCKPGYSSIGFQPVSSPFVGGVLCHGSAGGTPRGRELERRRQTRCPTRWTR